MNAKKMGIVRRTLAMLLSMMVLLGAVPITAMASTPENPFDYTMTVNDSAGQPIDGASIAYSISSAYRSTGPLTATAVAGEAVLPEVTEFEDDINNGTTVTLTYSVAKAGYVTVNDSVEIYDLLGNENVVLRVPVTLSVNKSGNGTVKFNFSAVEESSLTVGSGTQVSVQIAPAADWYIKSIVIGGQAITINDANKYYYQSTFTPMTDTTIDVVFTRNWNVTTTILGSNGVIKLDDSPVANGDHVYQNGSQVKVEIIPDEGYSICYLCINGEPAPYPIGTNLYPYYTTTITVDKNSTIQAKFKKKHTVTVNYNSEDGSVSIKDPIVTPYPTSENTASGQVISVVDQGGVTIVATPDTGCRVSQVKVDGVITQDNLGNTYTHDNPYNHFITKIDKDQTIEFTFSPMTFTVTTVTPAPANGTIMISNPTVDYGGSTTVTVDPASGFVIQNVQENGKSVTDFTDKGNGTIEFNVPNITENKVLNALFSPISSASINDFTFDTTLAIRKDTTQKLYVYPRGTIVSFSTTKEGIRLIRSDNTLIFSQKHLNAGTISRTSIIGSIALYYRQGLSWDFYPISEITNIKPLQIVIDDKAPTVTFTANPVDTNGFISKDTDVSFEVKDDYTKISMVEYCLTYGNDLPTVYQPVVIPPDATYDSKVLASALVEVAGHDKQKAVLHVKVVDEAGNEEIYPYELNISTTPPTVSVQLTAEGKTIESQPTFYSTRTATITIEDWAQCFDEQKATEGIIITATDSKGIAVPVDKETILSNWVKAGDKFTATLSFSANANYEWDISYSNKAGMASAPIQTTVTDLFKFTIDNNKPTGVITIAPDYWNSLLSTITFGLWKNQTVTASVTADDATSPIHEILYYKSSSETPLTEENLVSLYSTGKFSETPTEVSIDEKFVVYVRISDKAGNDAYISSNGVIVDKTDSIITFEADPPNEYEIYNTDVNVKITVNEEIAGKLACSGIQTVDFAVIKDDDESNPTQSGRLFTFQVANPSYADLVKLWTGSIIVDKELNNSDNVKLVVSVKDNAGNEYKQTLPIFISIDSPKIQLSFDNNANESTVGSCGYFGGARTATITITEDLNVFLADNATKGIVINAVDAQNQPIVLDIASMISDWTSNGAMHTATITFSEDGVYSWTMSYINKAGNINAPIDSSSCTTPFHFAVDMTDPTGKVTVGTSIWDQLLTVITFGIYSNSSLAVSAEAQDVVSPVTIEYYKTSNPTAMTVAELGTQTFQPFAPFNVDADEQFVVYLRITDAAGNISYVSSNGCIVDATGSQITLTPETPNANGFYKTDVNVAISVSDSEPYSGIRSVDYWVVKDNDDANPTQQGNLFTASIENPTQAELIETWSGNTVVTAALNNSCNVVLYVRTIDNAGNEVTQSVSLDIDCTSPAIQLTFDNNTDFGGNSYFDASRTATVVISERSHHFDASAATQGIVITAVDALGNKVASPYIISGWQTTESPTDPDTATHTATIQFLKDANYTLGIAYTDEAGNANSPINTKDSVAPFDFTVDTNVPSGTVTATSAEGRVSTWDSLIRTLLFGYWSNQKITISGSTHDVTSPIASVQYYKDTSSATNPASTPRSEEQLAAITSWTSFTGLELLPNEQVTVYLKITDMAGNITFISTNGLIVDDKKPLAETLAPDILLEPKQPINDIYRGDASVSIKITDPLVNGAYSGLKEVSYKVFDLAVSSTDPTQSGILYTFATTDPTQEDLLKTWSGSITVDSKKNNSNNIEVVVYSVDNAGNSSESSVTLKIDTTAPTVTISYDNNSADNGTFFKAARTATIVVTERNFDPKDVLVAITNSEGSIPAISAWAHVDGSGNRDNTKWTATITYATDGDYTFGVNYTDEAGNPCPVATFAASTIAGEQFTVDKTLPTVSVSYDNNSALNTSYYKAARTATIVIVEHNFQPDRVKIDLTASDDGTTVTLPSVSSWSTVGDRHTATINYSADATYSFDISVTDKAGNLAAEFEKQTFTIDTTLPELVISGVVNETAYKGDVNPVVTGSDTNFDASMFAINLTGVNRKTVNPDGSYSIIENGSVFTFKNFAKEKEVDDIYTLTANLTDKAGNSSSQTITFSVNRFGSTYVLGASIAKIQGTFVRTPEDVVVTETNPNKLSNIKVTLFKNDATRTLVEGEDYEVVITGGEGKWYQYTYTIFKKNFEDDGIYRISIHSEDEAGNIAENTQDTKDKEISFGVDKTPPNIVVANLENGLTYAVEALTAQLSVNDNLKLATVTIYLDGQEVSSWSGESMDKLIANGGRIEFLIEGDSINAHEVRIVSVDAAGNESTVEIRDFFVTTNLWVRFFNNRAMFFGSIAGILLLAFIVVLLVIRKRRSPKRVRV